MKLTYEQREALSVVPANLDVTLSKPTLDHTGSVYVKDGLGGEWLIAKDGSVSVPHPEEDRWVAL